MPRFRPEHDHDPLPPMKHKHGDYDQEGRNRAVL